jgi:hypothetical protein
VRYSPVEGVIFNSIRFIGEVRFMKKMVFCIIPLIMVLIGCASSGTTVAETNGSFPGMDLDAAIREAAAQMGENLPGGMEVALISVASSSTQFSEYVISRLEAALVSGKKLVVVDRANLDQIRAEQGFQLSGEVDDNSAKNIGKLLGAGAIVTGAFTNLGDVYSLTLKAINIETATVAVSYPADIAKSTRIETLLASGGGEGTGTRTVQAGGRQAASQPAAPATQPAPAPAPVQTYNIGDTGPAGGIIFYDKKVFSNGWRYMEAIPAEMEFTAQWGTENTIVKTETAVGTGKRNTQLIVEALKKLKQNDRAAELSMLMEYGGYKDWFLPSMDEMGLMFENLWENDLGDFSDGWYWSSSEFDSHGGVCAWALNFKEAKWEAWYYNTQGRKNYTRNVRAIRQF